MFSHTWTPTNEIEFMHKDGKYLQGTASEHTQEWKALKAAKLESNKRDESMQQKLDSAQRTGPESIVATETNNVRPFVLV